LKRNFLGAPKIVWTPGNSNPGREGPESAENGTFGRLSHGAVPFAVRMKGRDPGKGGGVGGLGKIFVAIEANRDSNFSFGVRSIGADFGGRPDHA
jgi:hypothetical protein